MSFNGVGGGGGIAAAKSPNSAALGGGSSTRGGGDAKRKQIMHDSSAPPPPAHAADPSLDYSKIVKERNREGKTIMEREKWWWYRLSKKNSLFNLAARKCRLKKKILLDSLQVEHATLRQENDLLERQVVEMRQQVEILKMRCGNRQ